MGLGVEEDLGVMDSIVVRPGEVLIGKRFEVGGGDQHGHTDVVIMEEVIEGGKASVSVFESFWGRERGVCLDGWQGDLVGICESEKEAR